MTPTLFDAPPPARGNDPQTSRDAATMPHLSAQRLAVLTALVAIGDCTPWAIVDRLNGPESGTALGARGAANTVWQATPAGTALVANLGDPQDAPRPPVPARAE